MFSMLQIWSQRYCALGLRLAKSLSALGCRSEQLLRELNCQRACHLNFDRLGLRPRMMTQLSVRVTRLPDCAVTETCCASGSSLAIGFLPDEWKENGARGAQRQVEMIMKRRAYRSNPTRPSIAQGTSIKRGGEPDFQLGVGRAENGWFHTRTPRRAVLAAYGRRRERVRCHAQRLPAKRPTADARRTLRAGGGAR
jgi:hypothetical protein